MSHLMLCHFGAELHQKQHSEFNRMFTELYKKGSEARRTLDQCLPFRDFLLQGYSSLERILVLINVLLFCASLSAENVDEGVSQAILYIMFAIAYFVTTTTCLSGANSLKRKVWLHREQSSVTSESGNSSQTIVGTSGDKKISSCDADQTLAEGN